MTDIDRLKVLLNALSDIDEGDEALLKVIEDYKFHGSYVVGNQKGLLKLAKGVLNAALSEPAKHELTIQVPNKPENESYPFGVASIERDEHLEYKPRTIDGDTLTYVDRDQNVGEKVLSYLWKVILIVLLLSLFVGFWTILKWSISLFS